MSFARLFASTLIGTLLLAMSLLGKAQENGNLSLYGAVNVVIEWYSSVWGGIFDKLSFLNDIPFVFIDEIEKTIIEFATLICVPFFLSKTNSEAVLGLKVLLGLGFVLSMLQILFLPAPKWESIALIYDPYFLIGLYLALVCGYTALLSGSFRITFIAVKNIVFAFLFIALLSTTNWVEWGNGTKPISTSQALEPVALYGERLQRRRELRQRLRLCGPLSSFRQ